MGLIKVPNEAKQMFLDIASTIIDSGNLAEGDYNSMLAATVCTQNMSRYCIPTSSNGTGIAACLNTISHLTGKQNLDVIIQANTMWGVGCMIGNTKNTIAGYIDCNIDTLMPSYSQFLEVMRSTLCDVVVLSHIGGWVNPDIKKIAEYCKNNGKFLVEDCAHSYGARIIDGDYSGNYGDFGVFSFYSTKAIMGGEGGAIVTNNQDAYEYLMRYSMYDRLKMEYSSGNNIRMSELNAAFIFSLLMHVDTIKENKDEIFKKYSEVCDEMNIPYIDSTKFNSTSNHYKFVIKKILPSVPKTSPVYNYSMDRAINLPGVKELNENHQCLPIWYGYEEVEEVVSALRSCK